MSTRKKDALVTLAEHGKLDVGTTLELHPDYCPQNSESLDSKLFQATVIAWNTSPVQIRWAFDGETRSLTSITKILKDEYGFPVKVQEITANWRRTGVNLSIKDEANCYPR